MTLFAILLLCCTDTAVRDDGRRLQGDLRLERSGQLVFTPQNGEVATGIVEYRFAGNPAPFRASPGMLLTLDGGQSLSCVLSEIDKDIVIRTAWTARLALPRAAVVSLTHLPGWRPTFHDDFTGKLEAWTINGSPKTDSGVVLSKPGQSLTCEVAPPVDEGRIGVNVKTDAPTGARWRIDATFARKAGDRTVAVNVGEAWSVDAGGLKGESRTLPMFKDTRRLLIEHSAGSLRITLDDHVLWWTLDADPGGPLKSVRLACVALDSATNTTGSVAFSQFCVDRSVAEARHPAGEPTRDELWLADGDQLFGEILRASARGVEMKARFGSKTYAWTQLRGVYFRQGEKPRAAKAPVVRLGIRGGLRASYDELEASVTALDAEHITIRHATLGEVKLPRDRVAWLRPMSR